MLQLSWFQFTLLNSILITLLNFNLFAFAYKNLESFWLVLGFIFGYFALIHMILSLIFVKYLSKFFSIFFIFCASLSAYFMYFYGILIDTDMVQNVAQTDMKEIKDLLNTRLLVVIFFIFLFCILVFKIRIVTQKNMLKQMGIKFLNVFLSLVLFLMIFMPMTKTYIPFFRTYKEIRMFNVPFYQIYALLRYYERFLKPKPEFKILSYDAFKEDNTTKKLLILVVGETARAQNYSLGTYKNNDTNAYTKKDKVVFFSHFYSCGTSTAISLPCMFSVNKRKDFSSKEFAENALDFLQKTGVNVSWYDNNSGGCKGVCDRIADKKFFDANYDEILLKELESKLQNLGTQNIIVLHLQGLHGPTYYKRYPENFKHFTPTCDTNKLELCSHEALINTYDNTLLYTDYILSQIIALLKDKKDYESAMIYLSDHGESLGENGIYLHSMPYAIAPKNQIHIPFIFWSNHSSLNEKLSQKKDLEFSQDNLFSTLLGYFGVWSSFYENKLDLFSSKENP